MLKVNCLNDLREDACFDSAETPFHNFAPLKETPFCPFAVFFKGSLRSISVSQRLGEEHSEFLVKRLHILRWEQRFILGWEQVLQQWT